MPHARNDGSSAELRRLNHSAFKLANQLNYPSCSDKKTRWTQNKHRGFEHVFHLSEGYPISYYLQPFLHIVRDLAHVINCTKFLVDPSRVLFARHPKITCFPEKPTRPLNCVQRRVRKEANILRKLVLVVNLTVICLHSNIDTTCDRRRV